MQAGINNKQDNVSYANLWLVAAAIINDSCFTGFSINKFTKNQKVRLYG